MLIEKIRTCTTGASRWPIGVISRAQSTIKTAYSDRGVFFYRVIICIHVQFFPLLSLLFDWFRILHYSINTKYNTYLNQFTNNHLILNF